MSIPISLPHNLSFPSGNGLAYGLFAYIPGLKARGFTRYIVKPRAFRPGRMSSSSYPVGILEHLFFGLRKDTTPNWLVARSSVKLLHLTSNTQRDECDGQTFPRSSRWEKRLRLLTCSLSEGSANDEIMKFRKKPVEVEVFHWEGKSPFHLRKWWAKNTANRATRFFVNDDLTVAIPTLEGTIIANVGDYIICGVSGEFYPCKPDIFEKTYDKVELSEMAWSHTQQIWGLMQCF